MTHKRHVISSLNHKNEKFHLYLVEKYEDTKFSDLEVQIRGHWHNLNPPMPLM